MKNRNCTFMNRVLFSISILFLFNINETYCKEKQEMNAFLSYATFFSTETGPYIETYLTVEGASVNYIRNENSEFQATIQVIYLFRKGSDIINYDKYELNSPALSDTSGVNKFNFMDQQRYSLANGEYEFEIQIWDKNNAGKPFINIQQLIIDFPDDKVTVSGVQFVSSFEKTASPGVFSKNGYDLIPYVFTFYPEKIQKITFYSEIYNSSKILGEGQRYLISYYIEPLGQDKPLAKYMVHKRETSADVNILFSELNISDLPSGNYYLVIEAKDQQNKLLGLNRVFFMRSNPGLQLKIDDINHLDIANTFVSGIGNIDTLKQYIKYLSPISTDQENNFALVHLNSSDLGTLQKFFFKFWTDRNEAEPQKAWMNYLSDVNKVNYAYSTLIQKGYETDRGRTYLKYGPPNAISESYNEPATYPYEIWHYYVLKDGQRNKKFIFYSKDVVTNDFALLHSDVPGEISNYRWQYMLYQRIDAGFDLDKEASQDNWGGNSKKYFDLPR
jgi:GWxTD domain-containing protein